MHIFPALMLCISCAAASEQSCRTERQPLQLPLQRILQTWRKGAVNKLFQVMIYSIWFWIRGMQLHKMAMQCMVYAKCPARRKCYGIEI